MSIHEIKITVNKKTSNKDIFPEYPGRSASARCDNVEKAMEFTSKGMILPKTSATEHGQTSTEMNPTSPWEEIKHR